MCVAWNIPAGLPPRSRKQGPSRLAGDTLALQLQASSQVLFQAKAAVRAILTVPQILPVLLEHFL